MTQQFKAAQSGALGGFLPHTEYLSPWGAVPTSRLKEWHKIHCIPKGHLTSQVHSWISFLVWSYVGVASTYFMPWPANLELSVMRNLSRERGAKLHHCAGWPPAYSHSCLLCCGPSWMASSTLVCQYFSLLLYPIVKCKFVRLQSESLTSRLVQSGFSVHTRKADSLPPLWWQHFFLRNWENTHLEVRGIWSEVPELFLTL